MKRVLIGMLLFGVLLLSATRMARSHEGEKHATPKAAAKVAAPAHKHDHAADTEDADVTIQGEVLDMACFMPHVGQGPEHQECALECLKNGAPAGLLTKGGKVYLLLPDHSKEKAFEPVKELAGEMAKVTGHIYKRGGVQAISVERIEKAK